VQAVVGGLTAGGSPGAAALVASVAGMPSPGAKAAAVLRHLPELAYLLLWRQGMGVELLRLLLALLGLVACRVWRLQVRGGCLGPGSTPAAAAADCSGAPRHGLAPAGRRPRRAGGSTRSH
jgi:hypothetical protein